MNTVSQLRERNYGAKTSLSTQMLEYQNGTFHSSLLPKPFANIASYSSELPSELPSQPTPHHSIEETLFDNLSALKVQISKIAMHLPSDQRALLFKRLDRLISIESWEEDDVPADQASFLTFLRVILFANVQHLPYLGLANGNILGAWIKGKNKLTIEFMPKDEVKWSIVCFNEYDERETALGKTPSIRLPSVLSPYNPDQWFIDAPDTAS